MTIKIPDNILSFIPSAADGYIGTSILLPNSKHQTKDITTPQQSPSCNGHDVHRIRESTYSNLNNVFC